jgi:secondary thiamine-phosphate synthase enzyme
MKIATSELEFKTTGETDIVDISRELEEWVLQSGIQDGTIILFISGSTAALTTIEFESGVVNDLRKAIERIAPTDIPYEHDRRWGDGNGYSHVRAALLGPSLCIPIRGGRVLLGTWQQVVLLDFDNRPRRRTVTVQIMGK